MAAINHHNNAATQYLLLRLMFMLILVIFVLLSAAILLLSLISRTVSFANGKSKIAFEAFEDENWDLYVMDILNGESANITQNTAWDTNATWSPNGDKIAFLSYRNDTWDVFTVESGCNNNCGEKVHQLTNGQSRHITPAWSPDGAQIAFVSYASPANWNWEIYVTDSVCDYFTENCEARTSQLTRQIGDDKLPVWSPDGKKIAFESVRTRELDIFVMDVSCAMREGSGECALNLTNNPSWDANPVWSPDGEKIAFVSRRDGNMEIYTIDTGCLGNNIDCAIESRNLTTHPQRDLNPVWSPDGKWLAFASDRGGNWDIFITNLDGVITRALTRNPTHETSPAWSSDSRMIAFTAEGFVYLMDIERAISIRLTKNQRDAQTPTWQP
jgi:Tol biopolymer transport system component